MEFRTDYNVSAGQKRRLAWLGMVVMIVIGIVMGFNNTMQRAMAEANNIFFYGENSDGNAIIFLLMVQHEQAANLMTVAGRYDANDTLVKDLRDASEGLSNATDELFEILKHQATLTTAFYALYDAMGDWALSETDAAYRSDIETDFAAAGDRIRRNPYNDAAATYNDMLHGYPARIINGMIRKPELPLFNGE